MIQVPLAEDIPPTTIPTISHKTRDLITSMKEDIHPPVAFFVYLVE